MLQPHNASLVAASINVIFHAFAEILHVKIK